MARVLWHVTMSLDGFAAGPGGDMSWMADFLGPNPVVDEVLPQIGAVLIGHRTYQSARTEAGRVYGGAWTGPQFVCAREVPGAAEPGFTFAGLDIAGAVAKAKAAAGDKYVAVLGQATARRCLEAGLVDELLVHIAPVLLGDGVRLFSEQGGMNLKFERISCTHGAKVTNLWLRAVRS